LKHVQKHYNIPLEMRVFLMMGINSMIVLLISVICTHSSARPLPVSLGLTDCLSVSKAIKLFIKAQCDLDLEICMTTDSVQNSFPSGEYFIILIS